MLQGRMILDPTWDRNTPGEVKILGPATPSETLDIKLHDLHTIWFVFFEQIDTLGVQKLFHYVYFVTNQDM